ncbi:MAG TPA: Rne/Rng family ribonuclease [Terracidiphilus sp.]|nr:Rne/Rng family ribonuclease [Terracidiphilus sp.]
MAKEICISSTPHETRLAILEDDQLAEIYYERENEYTLAGSIYKGRVTRVLPGMQSAFVDLGLERDAFLYVTDFLEMEDQEESDELERAATTGAVQAAREGPREPREGRGEGRSEERRDRYGREGRRERRPAAEFAPEAAPEAEPVEAAPDDLVSAAPGEEEGEGTGEPRRWRGRRRRRGGRGQAISGPVPVSDPVETEASAETYLEPADEGRPHADPEAFAHPPAAEPEQRGYSTRERRGAREGREQREGRESSRGREPRPEREPAAFVLPGESLSKYGGEPAQAAAGATTAAAPPARRRPTSKPSTLVEAPLGWDGSGLLPGESLARHRRAAGAAHEAEPEGVFAGAADAAHDEISADETIESTYLNPEETPLQGEAQVDEELVEEELIEDENLPGSAAEPVRAALDSDPFNDPFFTESRGGQDSGHDVYRQEEYTGQRRGEPAGENNIGHAPIPEPSTEVVADWITAQKGDPDRPVQRDGGTQPEAGNAGHEGDRSASHHVDPLPPNEFRLFGIGGKKKKDEEPEYPAPVKTPEPSAAQQGGGTATAVSSFAPGTGVVEEEVIEGEEYDAPRHHHGRHDEHDFDDLEEEEKLQTQIRSGEIGEMLQEAHLDHKIQLNFGAPNGEEDLDIDEEEEEEGEEPAQAEGAPAPGRRERGGRGRRGERGDRGERRRPDGRRPSRRSAQTSDLPTISELLKPGQEILVQIAKEPIAKKGARITSHIALPGRFLVFMPTVSHVGVSRKIASDEERQRLKRILTNERGDASGGFIVRTAAEGASEEELRADLRFLIHLWDEIRERSEKSKAPALIYHDLSLIERILRDQVSADFSSIWVDSQDDYERIVRFLNRFAPTMVRRVKLYTKETPLFDHFGVQDEISKALRSKVWLKSGGSIVINQTEALVAIDINTGKYVGKTARLEDTIVKTNLDAIPEIVRQIRLRDLGGIIVIDFIDMDERKNRFRVLAALEEALKADRAPTKVLQFNDFGLVAITRKRVKQSLERTLSVPCYTCQATGMVKSPATVCNEIWVELRKMRRHFENSDVLLRVHPETVKVLKANNARWLMDFEELTGKNILVKSDATLHPEQFDIQG